MSVARGNGQNGGHYYSNITQPVKLDLSFTVDATNGLGVTSVKSNGYARNVFMHTSTTPSSNNGYLNPNPVAGYALIQLNNNYNHFLGMSYVFRSPPSGASLTATTAGLAYQIITVGTTTLAQWQAAGLPAGITPAVGISFVAIATGSIGGTGTVNVPATAGAVVAQAEVIGNPDLSSSNSSIAVNGGAWLLVRFMDYAGAIVAPAAGSVCSMSLYLDASSVTIDGL